MAEKPEEEFEDEDADELADEEENLAVDRLMRDFDTRGKRRSVRVANEPAWRKLERLREDQRTKGLMSDFEDYNVDDTAALPDVPVDRRRRSRAPASAPAPAPAPARARTRVARKKK